MALIHNMDAPVAHEDGEAVPPALSPSFGLAARRALRRRRARRGEAGVTLVEIMIVVVIMAMIATAAAFIIPEVMLEVRTDQTRTNMATVQSAAEGYWERHRSDGCPAVEDLPLRGETADGWGNDFQLDCEDGYITLVSAGPDGQFNTEDDIASE